MSAGNYGVVCENCSLSNTFDEQVNRCSTCAFHKARLREQYAGMAMQGCLSTTTKMWDYAGLSKYATEHADALIAQLTKEGK